MGKDSLKVLMIGFLFLSFLIPPPAFAQEKEPIEIGFISHFSGPFAQNGKDNLDGAKLYLGKSGYKISGRSVEILAEDEEASPSTALTKAKKLVELNKVNFLVGPVMASAGYAVAPYAESKRTPDIIFSASDDLTQRKRGKYIFRAGMASCQPAHIMGEYAYNVLGYRNIVAVGMDYAFGWETVGAFQRAFESLGGKVIQKIWTPVNTTDFSPYLPQIRKDADAVHALMAGNLSFLFIKQFLEYGLKDRLSLNGVGQLTDEAVLPAMGDGAVGVITALPYSPMIDTPINREFVKTYREKFGKTPSLYSELGYTAMSIIDQAVLSLKGNIADPEKVAESLRSVYLKEAPRGPIKFDAYGNPVQNIYIRKVERVGGELQNTVIYTYPEVSQFWTFKPQEFLKQPVYSRDYPPLKP
jgi:branched-chain amino acid transport system substrate-binding protein